MLEGEWHSGRILEFAKTYGVTPVAVRDWSRQAGRFLRMCRGSEEEFRERLLANLDFAGRKAMSLRRTWIGKDGEPFETEVPDVKAYIAAQVEQARLLRLAERGPDDEGTEQVPVDQLAAALRALGHEVKLNERRESSTGVGEGTEGGENSGGGSGSG